MSDDLTGRIDAALEGVGDARWSVTTRTRYSGVPGDEGYSEFVIVTGDDGLDEVLALDDSIEWHEWLARLIAAAPSLLAEARDEITRLRELCGFLIDAAATHRIAVPLNSSLLGLAADIAGGALLDAPSTGEVEHG